MKEEEDPTPMMGDSEMQADDGGFGEDEAGDGDGEGWDEGEGGGWDDYGEEDEMDEVVKQALEATRKQKELEEKIEQVRITFKPPNYREG